MHSPKIIPNIPNIELKDNQKSTSCATFLISKNDVDDLIILKFSFVETENIKAIAATINPKSVALFASIISELCLKNKKFARVYS